MRDRGGESCGLELRFLRIDVMSRFVNSCLKRREVVLKTEIKSILLSPEELLTITSKIFFSLGYLGGGKDFYFGKFMLKSRKHLLPKEQISHKMVREQWNMERSVGHDLS